MVIKVQSLRHLLYIRIDAGSILDPEADTQSKVSRTFSSLDCCIAIITHIRRYRRLTYTYVITALKQKKIPNWPIPMAARLLALWVRILSVGKDVRPL